MSTAGTVISKGSNANLFSEAEDAATAAATSIEEESPSEQSSVQQLARTSTESTESTPANVLDGVGRISISSERSVASDPHIVLSLKRRC